MENLTAIWNRVLDLIKADILPVSYETWIKPIVPVEINENRLVLQVPNEYNITMICERYMDLIKNSILYITGIDYEIDIILKEEKFQHFNRLF